MLKKIAYNLHILRLSARLATKYTLDKINHPFKMYSYRNQYPDVSRTIDFFKEKERAPEYSEEIVYLGKEEDVLAWQVDTDYRLGGNSTATLNFFKDYCNSYLVLFKGRLQHLKELDYQDRLYCEMLTDTLVKKMFRESNGIRITVKSDGNNYILSLSIREDVGSLDYIVIQKQALIQDKSQDWATLEIPLSNMILDPRERKISKFLDLEIANGIKIVTVSVGIYSYEQAEGPFEICIKKIEVAFMQMIYKESYKDIVEKYPHPIMFKKVLDDGVDTGNGKMLFDKKKSKQIKWWKATFQCARFIIKQL